MGLDVNKRLDLKRNSMPSSPGQPEGISKAYSPYDQTAGCRKIIKEGKNGRRIVTKIIVKKRGSHSIDTQAQLTQSAPSLTTEQMLNQILMNQSNSNKKVRVIKTIKRRSPNKSPIAHNPNPLDHLSQLEPHHNNNSVLHKKHADEMYIGQVDLQQMNKSILDSQFSENYKIHQNQFQQVENECKQLI